MGNLDFIMYQLVGFLSFNLTEEFSVNRNEVYMLVVKLYFFTILGFLYESFNLNVLVFLENLPHLLSGVNEVFLLLKPLFEYDIKIGEQSFKAGNDVRILVDNVLIDFG